MSNKNERLEMVVRLQVTESQALALQAMFKCWNALASLGSSRHVAMYVDGDGNFKPKAEWEFSRPIAELTSDLEEAAHYFVEVFPAQKRADGSTINPSGCDHAFDFDPIAWKLQGDA